MSKTVEEWIRITGKEVKTTTDNGDVAKLSTCAEWESGYYGSDANYSRSIRPVVDLFIRQGYRVTTGCVGGVTDFYIHPKVDMKNIEDEIFGGQS